MVQLQRSHPRTTHATEAFDKLRALLALVGNELELRSEALVVVGKPLHQWHALHHLQFYIGFLVAEQRSILFLIGLQEQNPGLASRVVAQLIPHGLQIFPHQNGFNGAHLTGLEHDENSEENVNANTQPQAWGSICTHRDGVLCSEAELAGVPVDLVKVTADQLSFLNELDVGQRLCRQSNGLVEAVLATVGHIHLLQHDCLQAAVKEVCIA